MTEEHSSPIKTPKQLVIVVLIAFAVPITVAVMVSQLVTSGEKDTHENDNAVLARIQPVGTVVLEGGAVPAAAPAAAAPAAGAPAAGAPAAAAPAGPAPAAFVAAVASSPEVGKKIYEATCVACHGAGVAGAPKLGDKAAWAPRIQTGMDALYLSALRGKNVMPPKGGNPSLSDADLKAAVNYMVAAAK